MSLVGYPHHTIDAVEGRVREHDGWQKASSYITNQLHTHFIDTVATSGEQFTTYEGMVAFENAMKGYTVNEKGNILLKETIELAMDFFLGPIGPPHEGLAEMGLLGLLTRGRCKGEPEWIDEPWAWPIRQARTIRGLWLYPLMPYSGGLAQADRAEEYWDTNWRFDNRNVSRQDFEHVKMICGAPPSELKTYLVENHFPKFVQLVRERGIDFEAKGLDKSKDEAITLWNEPVLNDAKQETIKQWLAKV